MFSYILSHSIANGMLFFNSFGFNFVGPLKFKKMAKGVWIYHLLELKRFCLTLRSSLDL